MLGNYEYPHIKLMLTKVKTMQVAKTKTEVRRQVYVKGNRDADTHVPLPLPNGLKAGEYIIMYQAEFTEDQSERKLVISVYGNKELKLERVSTENYPPSHFSKLDFALYEQMMAEDDDYID